LPLILLFQSARRYVPWLFLAYRTALVAYNVAWFSYSFHVLWQAYNLFLYLTNWTYFFFTCYLTLYCGLCWCERVRAWRRNRTSGAAGLRDHDDSRTQCVHYDTPAKVAEKSKDLEAQPEAEVFIHSTHTQPSLKSISVLYSVLWVLYEVVLNAFVIITPCYWIFIYPNYWIPLHIDLNIHLFNTVILLVDLIVCPFPIRLLHVVYCQAYGFIYCVFSIIYWSLDPENNIIYPGLLDWNKPLWTALISLLLFFVVQPVVHCIMYLLYLLKMLLCCKMSM
jgi:hypothetical protein